MWRALRKLREFGVENPEAVVQEIAGEDATCAICGIPNRFLFAMARLRQTPPFGDPRFWSRLQIDHTAWDPPRVRPLCYFCNNARGKGKRTDAEVWIKAFGFWTWLLPERELGWLKGEKDERRA